ncbi:P-ATPase superfamily cation transporter [Actinomyces denticolens]|nr:P-ATPase superfamily cation transporter [Actinomyces denticolens]
MLGRVVPEQKKALVAALQARGRTVAMTGDGVNDALALKHADLGIAMGNGAPATKAVARLVLLTGKFSALPGVVAEGRRVMANTERIASLFLSKTVYASLIAVAVAITAIPYPFLPRQLTIVSSLTIGVPAFVLALAPTKQRYRAGFLRRVLTLAVPAGVVAGRGRWPRAPGCGARSCRSSRSPPAPPSCSSRRAWPSSPSRRARSWDGGSGSWSSWGPWQCSASSSRPCAASSSWPGRPVPPG